MKGVAPLLGAGGAFTASVVAGFGVGVLVDEWTRSRYYTLAGLFIGIVLGGYGAFRLLLRSL